MIYEEKSVASNSIFKGKIIDVRVDKVQLPDGTIAERELVGHPGGVGVVAITDNNEIILVKQYRKPIEEAIYEIPAGKLDPGEEHCVCGKRELEEETGYRAKNFEYLGGIYPSPGFTNEITHIYMATELYSGDAHPDEDEYLDVVKMPMEQATEMIMKSEIYDAKTVVGILKAIHKSGAMSAGKEENHG